MIYISVTNYSIFQFSSFTPNSVSNIRVWRWGSKQEWENVICDVWQAASCVALHCNESVGGCQTVIHKSIAALKSRLRHQLSKRVWQPGRCLWLCVRLWTCANVVHTFYNTVGVVAFCAVPVCAVSGLRSPYWAVPNCAVSVLRRFAQFYKFITLLCNKYRIDLKNIISVK